MTVVKFNRLQIKGESNARNPQIVPFARLRRIQTCPFLSSAQHKDFLPSKNTVMYVNLAIPPPTTLTAAPANDGVPPSNRIVDSTS